MINLRIKTYLSDKFQDNPPRLMSFHKFNFEDLQKLTKEEVNILACNLRDAIPSKKDYNGYYSYPAEQHDNYVYVLCSLIFDHGVCEDVIIKEHPTSFGSLLGIQAKLRYQLDKERVTLINHNKDQ